ncbi:hypothetical protein ERC79_04185 [Rhodococcus sp. ABRD24]|uniref:hypothetical protein n=1 Tax=Rhodococcus sp. ABRD24 TaxID=2507582 RepID=UPI00103AB609|nr:hypothetical protein [Rhodococcus sp. ABRD24]QBJ95241.1 hypothetical protein ERC79_04185 [Rhodococcus sp. ABRD24]
MSPQEKLAVLWRRIPRKLFGGRMRTTTLFMCVLWLALAVLNAQLVEDAQNLKDATSSVNVERPKDDAPAPKKTPPEPSTSTQTSTQTATPSSEASSTPSESGRTSQPPATPPGTTTPGRETTTPGSATSRTTRSQTPAESREPNQNPSADVTTTLSVPGG